MWKVYTLEMRFKRRLIGGVPLKEELVRPWLESRKPASPPAANPAHPETGVRLMEELESEVIAHLPEDEVEEVTKGFLRDDEGFLVVGGFTVRAHLKDCAYKARNVIEKRTRIKAIKSKVNDRIFVVPDLIRLVDDSGRPYKEPDGFHEHPVHAMTRMGPRTSLTRAEYLWQPVLRCELHLLDDGVIKEEVLKIILDYGQVHGYGAERNLQEGQYEYSLEEVK